MGGMDYGVLITKHAACRLHQRSGLNKKSMQRIVDNVYISGYPIDATKGGLKRWMAKIAANNLNAQDLRLYGDKLYIFSDNVLVTVLNVPNDLKKNMKKMIEKESSDDIK